MTRLSFQLVLDPPVTVHDRHRDETAIDPEPLASFRKALSEPSFALFGAWVDSW
jgi:hypothetical protein